MIRGSTPASPPALGTHAAKTYSIGHAALPTCEEATSAVLLYSLFLYMLSCMPRRGVPVFHLNLGRFVLYASKGWTFIMFFGGKGIYIL